MRAANVAAELSPLEPHASFGGDKAFLFLLSCCCMEQSLIRGAAVAAACTVRVWGFYRAHTMSYTLSVSSRDTV